MCIQYTQSHRRTRARTSSTVHVSRAGLLLQVRCCVLLRGPCETHGAHTSGRSGDYCRSTSRALSLALCVSLSLLLSLRRGARSPHSSASGSVLYLSRALRCGMMRRARDRERGERLGGAASGEAIFSATEERGRDYMRGRRRGVERRKCGGQEGKIA